MLISLFVSIAAQAAPLTVMIDAGHGGKDHGTTRAQVRESDITLSVAKRLHDLLAKDKNFRPRLTRDSDRRLSLAERSRLAKESKADVFISVHVNSNPEPRAKGAEFYFQNQLPPDEESMYLAHKENEAEATGMAPQAYDFVAKSSYSPEVGAIVTDLLDSDRILRSSQLTKALKSSWRGTRKNQKNSVRQAPFFVLSQMQTPSALVELGFLTNNEDFRDLTDSKVQAKMAEDLYRGLIQYRESITQGNASR